MMSKVASAVRQPILKWTDKKFDVQKFLKGECNSLSPFHTTALGSLYATDCMNLLPLIKDEVVDTVFADPPFNLGKQYGENTDDSLPSGHYLQWCNKWLAECVRVLKPGGSLFVYNLPKWNVRWERFFLRPAFNFVTG
jgi:site-specific DNA-methyltransferase (adenine-specific)